MNIILMRLGGIFIALSLTVGLLGCTGESLVPSPKQDVDKLATQVDEALTPLEGLGRYIAGLEEEPKSGLSAPHYLRLRYYFEQV